MELYKSIDTGELIWNNDLVWSEDFDAYVFEDREYWLDDDMADVEAFTLLDVEDWDTFKLWCKQEDLKENDYLSLAKYVYLADYQYEIVDGKLIPQTFEEFLRNKKR
jgi:hypothetical protein